MSVITQTPTSAGISDSLETLLGRAIDTAGQIAIAKYTPLPANGTNATPAVKSGGDTSLPAAGKETAASGLPFGWDPKGVIITGVLAIVAAYIFLRK